MLMITFVLKENQEVFRFCEWYELGFLICFCHPPLVTLVAQHGSTLVVNAIIGLYLVSSFKSLPLFMNLYTSYGPVVLSVQ